MDTNDTATIARADATRFAARFVWNSDRYCLRDTVTGADIRSDGDDYLDARLKARIDRLNRKYVAKTAGPAPADVIAFRICRDASVSAYDPDRPAHVGPYMTGADGLGGDCWANNRPGPDADGIPDMRPDEVCGFASLADLVAWFPADRWGALADAGFTVRAFRVPFSAVRFGRRQVVFSHAQAAEAARWTFDAFPAVAPS